MGLIDRVAKAGHRLDAWNQLGRLQANRVAILTYHGVSQKADDLGVLSGLHVSSEAFDAQLGFLAARYRVLPLPEVLDRFAAGKPVPRGTVCITFDDGYRNNYTVAFPALKRHGLPATIFLATQFVGGRHMLWHDRVANALRDARDASLRFGERVLELNGPEAIQRSFSTVTSELKELPEPEMLAALERLEEQAGVGASPAPRLADSELMSWTEARTMLDSGLVTFGSHTATHPILSRLTPARLREELSGSRARLEDELGTACPLLAYPNGKPDDITREVVQCARDAGYSHGLTTVMGRARNDGDPMRVPRLGAGEHLSRPEQFAFQVSGARAWLMAQRRRIRRAA